ncbi:MAG: phage holin family protein [Cyanobacteria bacterium P01_D01_bin.50]
MDLNSILTVVVTWLVTSASFLVISRIPLIGVEVDSKQIGLISGAVLGIINVLVQPIIEALDFRTFGLAPSLVAFIISVICFGITALLIKGFHVNGIWGAVFGALALSVVSNAGLLLN